MSYVALARKWRPRSFATLVGQPHITKPLINSLQQQRLHHAYLFTGTRGVGKTSIARLLAKALNCEQGIVPEPCLQCATCLAIEEGRFIDLIEIDGASRTRVEDTREILDNVQYAPATGRFKIYLIDEVHMLSQHSFNALLKTLEEPPAHVKFLLATTDPQKLPITVLSRCLQFHLKHLTPLVIQQQIEHILDAENITAEKDAMALLAQAARGSMRDGLSLLDQAIATCGQYLTISALKDMLGMTHHDYALQLLEALAALNVSHLLTISQHIDQEGGHYTYVLDELVHYLHQICIQQQIPQASQSSFLLTNLCEQFTPEDTQLFYHIALQGREELAIAPTPAIGFDMILLRMYTFRPASSVRLPILAYATPIAPPSMTQGEMQQEVNFISRQQLPNEAELNEKFISPITKLAPPEDIALLETTDSLSTNQACTLVVEKGADELKTLSDWTDILPKLGLSGLALTAAENASLIQQNENNITLRATVQHQSLFTSSVVSRLEQALAKFYQRTSLRLTIKYEKEVDSPAQQKKITQAQNIQDAENALHNDPFFKRLQEEFSAELVKNSITLTKDNL